VPEVAPPATDTCLCFDYGSRRIGTAIGQRQLQSARPLTVVTNTNGTPDWPAVDALIEQWQPSDLVVGWPLTEDGEEQPLTHHVRGFIKRLEQRYALPVHKADERYSSMAAHEQIRQQRQSGQRKRRTRHGDVDTVAAALILESWFSLRTNT
jgi:putative Holliday junction resolvase